MATTVINGLMQTGDYAPSTLDLTLNQPELYSKIIRQHSSQYRDTFGYDFRKMGLEMPLEADYGTLFLEGWVHENFVVAAGGVAASQAGGTQVIPLDATSIDTNRFYPKVSHVIVYPTATNQKAVIESIDLTAGTVTARAGFGVTLPLLAGGETIAIISSQFGEGTTQPEPSKKLYEQIHYQTQIIKDEIGITGSQLTNKAWVDISEYGGQYKFYNVALGDLDVRMDILEEGAYLDGDGLTYTPTPGTILTNVTTTSQQTKGLLTWGKERGENAPVDPAAVDKQDMRDMADYFYSQGDRSKVLFGWAGLEMGRGIADWIDALVVAAGATDPTSSMTEVMGMYGVDSAAIEARAASFSKYRQYRDFDRDFVFRPVESFSDPKGLGADGYTYTEKSAWFPMCNIKDGKTGNVCPNVAIRYKAMDGYSRRRELVELYGAGNDPRKTTQYDLNQTGMRAEVAMQVMNPTLIYLTNND